MTDRLPPRTKTEDHAAEIDRCNQRGGRMLSVVDLLDAGTLDTALAAYFLAVIGKGHSFMIGAGPGGAGKTTIMCALLNFIPRDMPLIVAADPRVIRAGLAGGSRACFLCHEIGRGHYFAYLWGAAAAAFFDLPAAGHMIATNLHADSREEARGQLVDDVGVSPGAFARVSLIAFVTAAPARGYARRIVAVYESDGAGHRLVFGHVAAADIFERPEPSRLVTPREELAAARVLGGVTGSGARTVSEVRDAIVRGRMRQDTAASIEE